jgi:preprotein translocase SecE subunit
MSKVAWPGRRAVLRGAAACLAVTVLVAVMIAVLDIGFATLVRAIGA